MPERVTANGWVLDTGVPCLASDGGSPPSVPASISPCRNWRRSASPCGGRPRPCDGHVDAAGRIALVNAQAQNVFGYTRSDSSANPVPEILVPVVIAHRPSGAAPRLLLLIPRRAPWGAGRQLFGRRRDGARFRFRSEKPHSRSRRIRALASIVDITQRAGRTGAVRQRAGRYHLSRNDDARRIVRLDGPRVDNSAAHGHPQQRPQAAEPSPGEGRHLAEVRNITDIVMQDERLAEVIRLFRVSC